MVFFVTEIAIIIIIVVFDPPKAMPCVQFMVSDDNQ